MLTVYVLYGILAGYFAGFSGIGAGVMLMPFFLMMGLPYITAVDASLIAVLISSLIGSLQHKRNSTYPWEPVLVMAIPGAFFALLGSLVLIHALPVYVLELIFAGILFLNVDLLRRKKYLKNLLPGPSKPEGKKYYPHYLFIGSITGLASSLLGIGGGIIIVPLLIGLAHYPAKKAVSVAVAIMVITPFFAILPHVFQQGLPYGIGFASAAGAILGGFFGTLALKYVKPDLIIKTNYTVSFILGFLMLFQALVG